MAQIRNSWRRRALTTLVAALSLTGTALTLSQAAQADVPGRAGFHYLALTTVPKGIHSVRYEAGGGCYTVRPGGQFTWPKNVIMRNGSTPLIDFYWGTGCRNWASWGAANGPKPDRLSYFWVDASNFKWYGNPLTWRDRPPS